MKVKLLAIDKTILNLCAEVESLGSESVNWRAISEEDLFYEVAVCIFGSQMLFETAVAMADMLKKQGLLNKSANIDNYTQYKESLRDALSVPIEITKNGCTRQVLPRFKNRLSSLLSDTAWNIYGQGASIKSILKSAKSAKDARKLLVSYVCGFGPKQASLFLRRVGYCSELAVLDTHVLDYLKISSGLDVKPTGLSRLSIYESIEIEFNRIAEGFGYGIGCVDLAMWITMRVAKREYAL